MRNPEKVQPIQAEVFGEPSEAFKNVAAMIVDCEDRGIVGHDADVVVENARNIAAQLEGSEKDNAEAIINDFERRLAA